MKSFLRLSAAPLISLRWDLRRSLPWSDLWKLLRKESKTSSHSHLFISHHTKWKFFYIGNCKIEFCAHYTPTASLVQYMLETPNLKSFDLQGNVRMDDFSLFGSACLSRLRSLVLSLHLSHSSSIWPPQSLVEIKLKTLTNWIRLTPILKELECNISIRLVSSELRCFFHSSRHLDSILLSSVSFHTDTQATARGRYFAQTVEKMRNGKLKLFINEHKPVEGDTMSLAVSKLSGSPQMLKLRISLLNSGTTISFQPSLESFELEINVKCPAFLETFKSVSFPALRCVRL